MERGQQFPAPQPSPSAVVPTRPKNTSTEPELPGWQKGVNTALDVLTVAELVAGLGSAWATGGTTGAAGVAGAAATQGAKFGAKKAIKAVTKAATKQGTKNATDALSPSGTTPKVPTPTAGTKPTAPTPPKATTSGTATDKTPTLPKLDDLFKPRTGTGTTKAPKADTTMGQIKDLFVPPKTPPKTKPLDDLFFPGAGKGVKGNKTRTTTKTKTEEETKPTTTKTKEEETTATNKSNSKAKTATRLGKGALGLAALAAKSLVKDGKDEERWKASGVV